MPTAQEILASDRPVTVVFSVVTDNTIALPHTDNDWVGGQSMLAYDLGLASVESNAQLYLSTGPVAGLSSNITVFGELFTERSLQAPFDGGLNIDYGKIDIAVNADSLDLYLRDWEDQNFTLYIGYEGSAWADFEILYTGKTLGHTLLGESIQVDLSINPTGTDKLFPSSLYSDGRAKPYTFGVIRKIKPVLDNLDIAGVYRFHSGSVGTTDSEFTNTPMGHIDPSKDIVVGRSIYYLVEGVGNTILKNVNNALPEDQTITDASITNEGDYIQMTLPDSGSSGLANNQVSIRVGPLESEDLFNRRYKIYAEMSLDDSSTVDSFDVEFGGWFGDTEKTITVRRDLTIATSGIITNNGSSLPVARIAAEKAVADDAETIVINVHKLSIEPLRIAGQDVEAYNPADGRFFRIPTFRVPDVTVVPSLPDGIAVYDDTGLFKIADDNTDFVIDCVGDTTNDDLVSACQYISTQANGSASPITSSITSPQIGIYCNAQRRIIDWWRAWCDPLDLYLDITTTTSTTDIKRRFNGQALDSDGNANVTNAFSFVEDDIDNSSFRQLANEPSVSRYEVAYQIDHFNPLNSRTVTYVNPYARFNQVRRIETALQSTSQALKVAEMNRRDGNRRSKYEFTVNGAGLGLKPNDVGRLSHTKVKDSLFTIRRVREYILTKKTQIEGIKNV